MKIRFIFASLNNQAELILVFPLHSPYYYCYYSLRFMFSKFMFAYMEIIVNMVSILKTAVLC